MSTLNKDMKNRRQKSTNDTMNEVVSGDEADEDIVAQEQLFNKEENMNQLNDQKKKMDESTDTITHVEQDKELKVVIKQITKSTENKKKLSMMTTEKNMKTI
jgi:hypothetical protein